MFQSRITPSCFPRILGRLATATAAFALTAGTATAAAPAKFTPLAGGPRDHIRAVIAPMGPTNAMATYIVEMAGAPVTVATDDYRALSGSEKQNLRSALRARQVPVEQKVRELGGQVLNHFELTYNGVKVRMPARSVGALSAIPGVVGVHRTHVYAPTNVHGVPLSGGPAVWGGVAALHGEGIKIAVIDTGVDYTHADFGGPGTVSAYQAALATDTADPDPALVGPAAPKVKGGVDLVGDDYNADPSSDTYQPIPHPDTNPLDCGGHGTHTSGTATGFGVLADGSTYPGPYDADTVASHAWLVGPGMAPRADLYAVRVFGCAGSTDVVVDAIEWATDHGMDVINMSLGSPFGAVHDVDTVASANAAQAGIIVVASAGNSGPAPYLVGSPSTGNAVVSVAASDPTPEFPAALVSLSTGAQKTAINANDGPLTSTPLPVKVLYTGAVHDAAHISLGCDPNEYTAANVTGALVVVKRGTCARVARAVFGQKAGAAAVLMINSTSAYPPFEGPITSNPDTGEQFHVTIPFLGLPLGDADTMVAADGGTAVLTAAPAFANPGYLLPASFTSGGPRTGDSGVKPEVTGPGVSIFSAGMGTGTGAANFSGTSMAAPHTAGEAALVRQAHPGWRKTKYWRAAIVNTADPALVIPYDPRIAGVGHIQALPATLTDVVALGDSITPDLSFGAVEIGSDYSASRTITLHNLGKTDATFTVGVTHEAGVPHTASLSASSVTVAAGQTATVDLTLAVPAATAGDASALNDLAGLVEFVPVATSNNGVTLRVPFSLLTTALSAIHTTIKVDKLIAKGSAVATVRNATGVIPGAADWYTWGLSGGGNPEAGDVDLKEVGAQSFPGVIAFAIKTAHPWSNPAMDEFDIDIDVDGDGVDDYGLFNYDLGAVTTGTFNGTAASFVVNLKTGAISVHYLTDAPFNGQTMVVVADFSQLCDSGSPCLSAANPRIAYHAESFGWFGGHDALDGPAKFNAFEPAISNGLFDVVPPGGSAQETVELDAAEWAKTPALGLMIVSHDNARVREAQTIPVALPVP